VQRTPIVLSLALAALLGAIVGLGAVADYLGRDSSPERVVRRYFAELEAGDASAALDELDPSARQRWSDFVENGILNTYRINGIAVRVTSIQGGLAGNDILRPREVTIFLDITEWVDGAHWQASPRAPLVQVDGRWYLGRPPLAPEA
jgi:hypothetical protein